MNISRRIKQLQRDDDAAHLRAMYFRVLFMKGPASDILLPLLRNLVPARDKREIREQIRKMDPNYHYKRYLRLVKRLETER
jgi:hypothetical protein